MVKKKLVKGTMLTVLAALGMSLNLSSGEFEVTAYACLLYTSPSPRDA